MVCVGNGSHFCTAVLIRPVNMCNIKFEVLGLAYIQMVEGVLKHPPPSDTDSGGCFKMKVSFLVSSQLIQHGNFMKFCKPDFLVIWHRSWKFRKQLLYSSKVRPFDIHVGYPDDIARLWQTDHHVLAGLALRWSPERASWLGPTPLPSYR